MKQIIVAVLLLALPFAADAQQRPPAQPWVGMSIRPFREPARTRMLHVEGTVPGGPSERQHARFRT